MLELFSQRQSLATKFWFVPSRQNESEIDNIDVQLWTSKLADKASHPVLGHFIFLLSELLKNLVQDRLSAIERRPQIALGLNGNN